MRVKFWIIGGLHRHAQDPVESAHSNLNHGQRILDRFAPISTRTCFKSIV